MTRDVVLGWKSTTYAQRQRHRIGHGLVQIADLEVEVHHGGLGAVGGRPDRRLVTVGLLEDEVDRALRRREDGGAGFFVADRPVK